MLKLFSHLHILFNLPLKLSYILSSSTMIAYTYTQLQNIPVDLTSRYTINKDWGDTIPIYHCKQLDT